MVNCIAEDGEDKASEVRFMRERRRTFVEMVRAIISTKEDERSQRYGQ